MTAPASLTFTAEGGYALTLLDVRRNTDGQVTHYSLQLTGPQFNVALRVNDEMLHAPPTDFFADMAAHWRGWAGDKIWGSLNDEYNLHATSDNRGHITLVWFLQGGGHRSGQGWCAKFTQALEAGQLQKLSDDIAAFFAP